MTFEAWHGIFIIASSGYIVGRVIELIISHLEWIP